MKTLILAAALSIAAYADPICGKRVITPQYVAEISCMDWDFLSRFMPVTQRGKVTQVIVKVTDPKVFKVTITVSGVQREINVVNNYADSSFDGWQHATFDVGVGQ